MVVIVVLFINFKWFLFLAKTVKDDEFKGSKSLVKENISLEKMGNLRFAVLWGKTRSLL